MKKNTSAGVLSVIAIVIIIGALFAYSTSKNNTPPAITDEDPLKQTGVVTYICMDNKTILAKYYSGISASTTTGEPPLPNGRVSLTLSDGRSLTLSQTISGSGVRYADTGETIVFWNKGNGVTFTESGKQTFMGCVAQAENSGGLPQVYGNGTKGFSIRYPANYTVDENYTYTAFGPSKTITGTKFTIPASVATGTNLSTDSYVSVEQIALASSSASSCSAKMFLDPNLGGVTRTVVDGNTTYSFASSTGAGAGNRYDESVYVLTGTNTCIAVRYFIHYGVIENYPKSIKEFDRNTLMTQFDAMRKSLVVLN